MPGNSNVPAIRFAGFTDPWEQRKLSDCGSTYGGLSGKTKDDFGHGDAHFVPYTNVFDNPIADISRLESVEIDPKQNEVRSGDALFTVSSETPEEVGMSSVWLSEQRNVYLNSFCFGFRQDGSFDPYYLAYMLRSKTVRANLTLLAQGISRFNISKNKVMELMVSSPEINEQKRVGAFFQQLDDLITLHQRKHDKLTTLKKSMLDKMFPKEGADVPEIRFAGFTDPWEQRKFNDVAELKRGLTYSPADVVDSGCGVRVLRSSNISEDQFVLHDDDVFVREEAVNIEYASDGDILITAANGSTRLVGKRGKISGLSGKTVHGGFMLLAKTDDPDFLNASMGAAWYHRFLGVGVSGGNGAIGNLDKDALSKQAMFAPGADERTAIGAFFAQLDDLITLHQRQLDSLKKVKRSCLDKMFV